MNKNLNYKVQENIFEWNVLNVVLKIRNVQQFDSNKQRNIHSELFSMEHCEINSFLYNSRYMQYTLVSVVVNRKRWERVSLLVNNDIKILYKCFMVVRVLLHKQILPNLKHIFKPKCTALNCALQVKF
jgi:hypothetical protein